MIGVGGLYRYYRACMETMVTAQIFLGPVPSLAYQALGWCRYCGDTGSAFTMSCAAKPCMARMEMSVLADLLSGFTVSMQATSINMQALNTAFGVSNSIPAKP